MADFMKGSISQNKSSLLSDKVGISNEFSVKNISIPDTFKLIGYLSPVFLGVFMLMSSFFNQDLKGLVWLIGALICCLMIHGIQRMQGFETLHTGQCSNPFISNQKFNSPSVSSAFILFTLVYLFVPMHTSGSWNFFVVVLLIWFYIMDAMIKLQNLCTPMTGIIVGSLLGSVLGFGYYYLISTIQPKLLYYTTSSNKESCSRPAQQTFKCSVYKNGELISTL